MTSMLPAGRGPRMLQGDCISRRGVPAEVSEVRREPREAGGRGTIDAFLAAAARLVASYSVLGTLALAPGGWTH